MQGGCKRNVLKQFESIRNLPKNQEVKSCVLILDTATAPILSQLFSLEELLQVGIKDLVRVDKVKKPQPASIGIYYISCQSLQYLYKDFSPMGFKKLQKDDQPSQNSNSEQAEPSSQSLYFSINLLLCQQASKDILHEISEHQEVIEKIASFGELYIPCRYAGSNLGIIPFSKITEDHIDSLRKVSKMTNSEDSKAEINTKNEKAQMRKKQHTQHSIHKNNLSCLPVIYFYEYEQEKAKKSKQLQKLERIEKDLQDFGKKLCHSVIAGINIGLTTTVRVLHYESKFCSKIKQSFMIHFGQFMQAKLQEVHQAELNESITGEKTSIFVEDSSEQEAKEVILLIADRQIDNLTPLIRSFYYSPLLRDIFEINDPPESKIKIVSKKIQPTVIEADDKIFNQYKNQFTPEIFQKINQNLQDYIASNKAGKFHKQTSDKKKENPVEIQMKDKSSRELREVIKQLPEYKKTIKSYHTNIEVLNCMAPMLKERNLYEEAELEHLIVTGFGGDRKALKDKKILQKIYVFLEDPHLTIQDKCRLMILGVCCLDLDAEERNKLVTRLNKVEGHGDIARCLSKVSHQGIKKYPLPADKGNKDVYMNRHRPTLSTLIEQSLANSTTKLKSLKMQEIKALESPNKPSLKGNLSKQKQKSVEYVVAMCGGMGFNEITDIERVFKNVNRPNLNVNFITDYVFTPTQYLEQLCTLL